MKKKEKKGSEKIENKAPYEEQGEEKVPAKDSGSC